MKHIDIEPGFVFSPQPMYLIGTNDPDGTTDFCVITWLGFSANMISEDILWLADYFGTTRAHPKNALPYTVSRGKKTDVPVPEESPWVYECGVRHHVPLEGANLFAAKITNIQIAEQYQDMDREHIDLLALRPAIYSPYRYYGVGEKLGEMGEWRQHYPDAEIRDYQPEKASGSVENE